MFHNHFVFPTFFCIFAVMSLNRTFKITIFVTILMLCLTVNAKEEFTPTEQQQISVETPGLFSHSDSLILTPFRWILHNWQRVSIHFLFLWERLLM